MSSPATAPGGATRGADPAASAGAASHRPGTDREHPGRPSPELAAAVLLGAALLLIAFTNRDGLSLGSNTWTEVIIVLLGTGAAVLALPWRRRGHAPGTWAALSFIALTGLTALSIVWSAAPDQSWLEANRMVSYAVVFVGAIAAARRRPELWRALLGGLWLMAVVVGLYGLVSKALPGLLDRADALGRLHVPLDYWNATGLVAALGLPVAVWLGARRDGRRAMSALAVPSVAILSTVVVFTYSRSAVVAAVGALAVWFCVVPLRLRGAAVLLAGGAGGAVITGWALGHRALRADAVPLGSRESAGIAFGIVLVLVLVVLLFAGRILVARLDGATVPADTRRRIGVALLAALALVPIGGIVALAASSRGLTGEISHAFDSLTSVNGIAGTNASRLAELGNSRPRYWRDGLRIGEHHLLLGAGAGTYGIVRSRYDGDIRRSDHAHSYPIETFADLGLLGVAVMLAVLGTWAAAARVTLRRRPGAPREGPAADERAGLLTLLCVVVGFGLHSAIDKTWEVPIVALAALLAAGWLAGRGGPEARADGPSKAARPGLFRAISERPTLGLAATAAVAGGLLLAWVVWLPLRSADAQAAAEAALTRGDGGAALSQARTAAASNPLAPDPLYMLADVYAATGRPGLARGEFVKATRLQPENPATWRERGLYEAGRGEARAALASLQRAHSLDAADDETNSAIFNLKRSLGLPTG